MKKKKRIVFGIVLILAAIGLLCFGFIPSFALFAEVKLWKVIFGLLILGGLIERLVFAKRSVERADCIFLLGLFFALFEKELSGAMGREIDLVNPWLVVLASFMLTVGTHAIFHNGHKHSFSFEFDSENGKHDVVTDSDYSSTLSENTVYFDLSEKQQFTAVNKLGQLNVYFQNEELCPEGKDIELCVDNKMGEMEIFVPAGWEVDSHIYNKLGASDIEESRGAKTRKLILTGENKMGEVVVKHI